jgi:hypothetical protein
VWCLNVAPVSIFIVPVMTFGALVVLLGSRIG